MYYHAGYSERFRWEVARQAIARYEGMLITDRDGQHPLYKYIERAWQKRERRLKKNNKKTDWVSRGGFDTIIMVNPTSGGELAKNFRKLVDENLELVKI